MDLCDEVRNLLGPDREVAPEIMVPLVDHSVVDLGHLKGIGETSHGKEIVGVEPGEDHLEDELGPVGAEASLPVVDAPDPLDGALQGACPVAHGRVDLGAAPLDAHVDVVPAEPCEPLGQGLRDHGGVGDEHARGLGAARALLDRGDHAFDQGGPDQRLTAAGDGHLADPHLHGLAEKIQDGLVRDLGEVDRVVVDPAEEAVHIAPVRRVELDVPQGRDGFVLRVVHIQPDSAIFFQLFSHLERNDILRSVATKNPLLGCTRGTDPSASPQDDISH